MAIAYPSLVSVLTTDTFEEWRKKTNAMIEHTQANQGNLGDLAFLSTDDKSTAVQALNEVDSHADTNTANIGSMQSLDSSHITSTLVGSINTVATNASNDAIAKVKVETDRAVASEGFLQNELNATQTGSGLQTNGVYSPSAATTYLTSASSLVDADNKLDAKLKEKSDLLETLSSTVGTAADSKFDWSGSTVNYLTVNNQGSAIVKDNFLALDSQIKINSDAQQANNTAIDLSNTKISNIISSLGGTNDLGLYAVDSRNTYATVSNVRDNIKLLDDNILLANQKIDNNIQSQLNALQDQINLRSTVESVGTASGYAATHSTLVIAINDLYAKLLPFVDGTNTSYVRSDGSVPMTGTLTISGGNLVVNGTGDDSASTARRITCTGDIVAYNNS